MEPAGRRRRVRSIAPPQELRVEYITGQRQGPQPLPFINLFIYLYIATPNSPRRANAKGEDTHEARTHTGTDKKKGQKGAGEEVCSVHPWHLSHEPGSSCWQSLRGQDISGQV